VPLSKRKEEKKNRRRKQDTNDVRCFFYLLDQLLFTGIQSSIVELLVVVN
jgi:hypothetical protein